MRIGGKLRALARMFGWRRDGPEEALRRQQAIERAAESREDAARRQQRERPPGTFGW